tara:strand:- start:430 stop:984 length:555 start_codon:yes stop_codon:yes gene_type:complete
MGNPIIKNFKMRRQGGEVGRASETSDLPYSENQIRTMGNMGMAASLLNDGHSNLNYGAPLPKTEGPKRDEFGTIIPKGFKSSTGQDYEITAGKGTLEGRQTLSGPRGRNQSPTVTQGGGKKPLETKPGTTTTSTDGNTTTRTTYGGTTRSQTPGTLHSDFKSGKKYDTTTDYKVERLKIKPYNA